MNRTELIIELKKHFSIEELVCNHVFYTFGEKAWQFFDQQLLETILVLRIDIHGKAMTINNWKKSGPFSQRGLRCNVCQICRDKTLVKQIYMSAHCNGAAIDYDVEGQTSEQSRQEVINNAQKLPYRVRLEGKVAWVHLDVYDDINSNEKVSTF